MGHMSKYLIGALVIGCVLVTSAFYFSSVCSVSGGMPSPEGFMRKHASCTCVGIEYQQREMDNISDKPSTYMCAGIVIDRYEE